VDQGEGLSRSSSMSN